MIKQNNQNVWGGIELSSNGDHSITIDGVTIHGNMIAVCKADSTGLLSVKYLKKSHTKQSQPKVSEGKLK